MARKNVSVRIAAEGGRQVRAEFQGVGEAGSAAFRRIEDQADVTGAVVSRVLGAIAAAFSVRELVQYADAWSDMNARVALAVGSQAAGVQVLERLSDVARQTYSALELTTESFLQNATALRELGYSTDAALDFTEALNLALVVSGAKAERAAQIQTNLAKAMAIGQLRGEELNTVIQNGGRVAELLAAELGVNVNQLRQLGMDGEITGAVIQRALVGNLQLLRDEADAMPATIGDAFMLLRNAAIVTIGTWDQMLGASNGVAQALILVADNMGRVIAQVITIGTVLGTRWVVAFVAARVATLGLVGSLIALRVALIRTGLGILVVGLGEAVFAFMEAVRATGSFRAGLVMLGQIAAEVAQRMVLGFQVAFAVLGALWEGYPALVFLVLDAIAQGVVVALDRIVAVFAGGVAAIQALWAALPRAIGDLVTQAANGVVGGVEAMLNGVVARINTFITGINAALSLLPDWAVGDGGVNVELLPDVNLGRLKNQFAGGMAEAGSAAANAFVDAFDRSYIDGPEVFGRLADDAAANARDYLDKAADLAAATTAPLEAWRKLQELVASTGDTGPLEGWAPGTPVDPADDTGSSGGGRRKKERDAVADLIASLQVELALKTELDPVMRRMIQQREVLAEATDAQRAQIMELIAALEAEVPAMERVMAALQEYAREAVDVGSGLADALTNGFRGAEDALTDFVVKGRLDLRSFFDSVMADITRVAVRSAILGPLANALGGMSGGGILAGVFHDGGMVGRDGTPRMVPAGAFAGAQRFHGGGMAGLRPDEVPAILQRGERVLSRREVAAGADGARPISVVMNITTPDANSFRQSQGQIMADARRTMARAGRNT